MHGASEAPLGNFQLIAGQLGYGVTPAPEMCGDAENSLPSSGQPAWFPGGQLGLLGMG